MDGNASYMNGFAPRDGEPLFPELWKDCVFAANPGLGPSGNTLRDWSGQKNHGTLLPAAPNGPTWGHVGGRQALSFNGTTNYVDAGVNIGNFSAAQPFVISCTVNRSSIVADAGIISRYEPAGDRGWQMRVLSSGALRFGVVESGGVYKLADTSILSNGVAYHLAGVWDGVNADMYVNGRLDSSRLSSGIPATITGAYNLYLGRVKSSHFAGSIYDAAIHATPSLALVKLLATRPGIAYELAPSRYAGDTAASYRRRLQAAQIASCGVIG